jgi:DNA-directed RNA polymerase specialized sigma24 family protein
MSMGFAPGSSSTQLGARDLRRNLTAMLERRLPREDVDDVAQTVLCDALQAERIPSDPVELRKWLAGIARHKVADFHRSRARTSKRTDRLDDEGAPEPECPPAPIEAREVLANVIDETTAPRDRETLGWLVREHAGDRLADIAKEAGLPSPVVRQRVSRLRRALRKRWAAALAFVFLLGGLAGGAYTFSGNGAGGVAIAPDPSVASPPVVAAAPSPLDGTWRVERIDPTMKLAPAQKELLDAELPTIRVKVQGARIDITAHMGTLGLTAKDVVQAKDGTISATVVAPNGVQQRVTIQRLGESRLKLTVKDARFGGTAVLVR